MRTSSGAEATPPRRLALAQVGEQAVPSAYLAEPFDLPSAYLSTIAQMPVRAGACDEIRRHGTATAPQPTGRRGGITPAMERGELAHRRALATTQTIADVADRAGSGPKTRALAALGR